MNIIIKKFILFAAMLAVIVVLCSCDTIEDSHKTDISPPDNNDSTPVKQAYPVSFDSESFDSSPQTVVSMSQAVTDILGELGISEKIIGAGGYCRIEGVETVGSPAFPDIDKIIELKPELVLTQSPFASADVVRLKQAGIRYLYLEAPKSFSYLVEEYIKLSMIFYGAVDSQDIAAKALSAIDECMLNAQNSGISKRFIIVEEKINGEYAVSAGDDLETDMLGVFGENVLDGVLDSYLTKDEIESLGFDIIFADASLKSEKLGEKNTKVIYIDMSSFRSPTSALCETISYCLEELG